MSHTTRFVIVSKDSVFCLSIKEGLKDFPDIEMVVNVSSQLEAENKISRRVATVLLIDADTVEVDAPLLRRMVSRFNNVLVVLTAIKEATARRHMSTSIRDFANKPGTFNKANVNRYIRLILGRVRGVESSNRTEVNYKDVSKIIGLNDKVVGIASSTGGVEALEQVFARLPGDIPPILVVQHMPSGFTKFLAERLDGKYPQKIKEAVSGEYLLRGHIYIAPAGNHMKITKKQDKFVIDCFMGPKMHGVIPAADILFESMAALNKRNAIGVVLTGMGADGGRGLMLMRNAGAKTIGQNEETCVVYGMPKVAKDLGAVDFELPIDQIAGKIMALA